jgi:shikimate kinase
MRPPSNAAEPGSGKTPESPSPSPSPSPVPSVVVLLGLPGAGKSTVGRILADRLDYEFIDPDEEIEKTTGTTIAEIFRRKGEAAFRLLERQLTYGLSSARRTVLAPGGGWIANPGAREALPADALLVWLRVSPEEAVRRVEASGVARPLLGGPDPIAAVRALGAARNPLYAKADRTVDVDGRSPDAIVNDILISFGFEPDGT